MSPYDNAGRIDKQTFIASTLTLFVLCLITACARFYIQIRVLKHFSIDDGILVFGIGCLICAMGLLFTFIDKMYLVGATEIGMPGIMLPPDFIEQAFDFQKLVAIALILTWCSIISVKFSYLFLFKRLIDRMPLLLMYWWVVFVFNAITSAYGAAVYIVACPDFYNLKSLQCVFGKGVPRSIAYSVSQMILDIVGDLLILYIPVRLIWRVKIRWTQKIALASCLCLTILTIMCTITRMSGIHAGRTVKSMDSIWGTYWQFVAANLALIMTAATAFRTFFVARVKDREAQSPRSRNTNTWYMKSRRLLRSVFMPASWQSEPSVDSSRERNRSDNPLELPYQFPNGTMTGVQTFIDGQGRTKAGDSQMMHSRTGEEYDDPWSLSTNDRNTHAIKVQHDVTLRFDDAC